MLNPPPAPLQVHLRNMSNNWSCSYRLVDLTESPVLTQDPETAGGQNSFLALGLLPHSWRGPLWGRTTKNIETELKGGSGPAFFIFTGSID